MKEFTITYKSANRTFRTKIKAKNGLHAREKLIRFVCPEILGMEEEKPQKTYSKEKLDMMKKMQEDKTVEHLKNMFGL